MFVESLEEVPENWRDQFEEIEVDGKKGYQDKDTTKAFALFNKTKEERADFLGKLKETSEKLEKFEDDKKSAIEQARADALEEARTKGDVEAIEKRYKEQMEDLERRSFEKGREEERAVNRMEAAKSKLEMEAVNIVSELGFKDDTAKRMMLRDLKSTYLKVDESANLICLNDDGAASSLDMKGLIAELDKKGIYDHLRPPKNANIGGGKLNGSNGGDAPTNENQAAKEAKNKGDLRGFLSASIKL